MEIKLIRETGKLATFGRLWVNDVFFCHTIEDIDRGLVQTDTIETIRQTKVFGQTAIPKGRYEIALTYSNRFKRTLPLLLDVPGFEGIRIHVGNTTADTLGCLLVGMDRAVLSVTQSRVAFSTLYKKLETVAKTEKIWITIS